jgi:methylated-DNA-[protein]-cysteine S-methyltransferase
MWFERLKTPIGLLTIAVDVVGLKYVLFENNKHEPPNQNGWRLDSVATREPREQLLQYFSGDRKKFDLQLSLEGTEFQQRTWRTLGEIPFGKTWSYAELATRVGSPKAVRAVGAANGRNPLPIVLPCHRVIGSNGSLTGFGGGLPTKKWLLELEGAFPDDSRRAI